MTIGLVPTMGALHAGHFALVDAARAQSDRVIATLFVNPTQFAPTEDFASYPRDEATDVAALKTRNVDLLFAPSVDEMYDSHHATRVLVGPIGDDLCGAHRSGFFTGVATVVAKLLLQALPTSAYFGEKDFQQLQVIRRMAVDLNIPVEICGVPTVREADGLALSSRNAYLTEAQRAIAPALYRILGEAADNARSGSTTPADIAAFGRTALTSAGFETVDYFEIRVAETLQVIDQNPIDADTNELRILAAAWLGKARLIDNIAVTA